MHQSGRSPLELGMLHLHMDCAMDCAMCAMQPSNLDTLQDPSRIWPPAARAPHDLRGHSASRTSPQPGQAHERSATANPPHQTPPHACARAPHRESLLPPQPKPQQEARLPEESERGTPAPAAWRALSTEKPLWTVSSRRRPAWISSNSAQAESAPKKECTAATAAGSQKLRWLRDTWRLATCYAPLQAGRRARFASPARLASAPVDSTLRCRSPGPASHDNIR